MNYIGILVSLLYIFLIMKVSSVMLKKKKFDKEMSRKFIHIGLGNWYLIAWFFFDNAFFAAILPAIFIVINYLSVKNNLNLSMEREENNSYGTVFYSISLLILTIVFFNDRSNLFIGALSALILGYGDGIAGLIGMDYGKHKLYNGKSLEGSISNFIVSFMISYLFLGNFILNNVFIYSFIIATFSMFIEAICTKGYDNLFLPLGISILTYSLLNYYDSYIFLFVVAVNLLIVLVANSLKLITLGGMITSFLVGFLIYYYGGLYSYIALILFFTSSNIIEIFRKNKIKKYLNPRTYKQVLANGLIPSILAIIYYITNHKIYLFMLFVSLAGSNSDTWSGEIGKYSKNKVKYILSKKVIEKGISGGITNIGIFGGLLGSLVISLISLFKFDIKIFIFIFLLGFINTIIDSILGEKLQGLYIDKNSKITEKYNKKYKKIKGYKFFTNNKVNLFTSIILLMLSFIVYNIIS
ncbi:MAG: DUF92 domain-containing protein [Bacilli bacterium]|nr:DUF92 domain-containing protein [Bacilli bacterium]